MFRQLFKDFFYLFQEELDNNSAKVDSSKEYYKLIRHTIPELIMQKFPNPLYKVYGSVGQGNLSLVPWVGIFNRKITESAQFGLYIVYLYSIDYKKLYLTLNQGFTHFKDIYKSKRYEYIRKTSEYFSSEMNLHDFNSDIPNLTKYPTDLAKGYAYGSIVYKAYDIDTLPNDETLYDDLHRLMKEYDELYNSFGSKSYDNIIKIVNGTDDSLSVDKAIFMLKEELNEAYKTPVDLITSPKLVKRGKLKSSKYARIKNTVLRQKLDYVRIARDNARIGLQGEQLALQIERDRLEFLGIQHIDKKLLWRANESDSYGYDIESVDIINGKEDTIYIEVKTTSDRIDSPFYITKREKEFSKEASDKYRILRIFDVDSIEPKYYYAEGYVEDNFILDPITYLATYKYEIE